MLLTSIIFLLDLLILYILLAGILWSVAFPRRRIWPPPGRQSWQYRLTWACFYLVFLFNALLIVLDWNSWFFKDPARLLVGIPLVVIGSLLVTWGIYTLGTHNTSGLRQGLVLDGPYRFTRNPQYLGDILFFLGLCLVANSLMLWVAHALLILVFLITPLSEEIWLHEQYGQAYEDYKRRTSRFI